MQSLTASFRSRDIARHLGGAIGALTCLSVAGQLARFSFLHGKVTWWVALFDLNREQNLPTYYQGISIFLAAVLLAAIARQAWKTRAPFRWAWTILSAGFVVLSIDETCMLHEQLELLMQKSDHHFSGLFRYSWVVPAIIIVAVIGCGYLRFLASLPTVTRMRFIMAAAIYLSGTIGMEMVGGWYDDRYGSNNITCQLLANIEELMEMSGIAIFIVALLEHIACNIGAIQIHVRIGETPAEEPMLADELPVQGIPSMIRPS
jgi:hypothetical protein